MLKENLKVKIVPQNIESTFESEIEKIDDEYVYFDLNENVMTQGEDFDGYAVTDNGILYFSTSVAKVDNNKVLFPKKTKTELLQRREFERLATDIDVQIKTKDNELLDGWLIDISVGGFKMHLKQEIDSTQQAVLCVTLNQKLLEINFKPVKFKKDMENLYTLSAKFENLSNTDKITLVQYCYKKQAEKISE